MEIADLFNWFSIKARSNNCLYETFRNYFNAIEELLLAQRNTIDFEL